ncbi:S-adenosyl-L-methionine-dependent methyltransferase, partial [Auriculariales sp. MPI-PUGE-AT-0066]
WDSVYKDEVSNFEEMGEEGEVWFGMETVDKMLEWTQQNLPKSKPAPSILDIGTGNGQMLISLVKDGFDPARMLGIDYSADSIRLARLVAQSHGESTSTIPFEVADFLSGDAPRLEYMTTGDSAWDLLLDKGTYDAIALSAVPANGPAPKDEYPLLKPGGWLLITSCNFTEDELKGAFASEATGLRYHSRIQHPTFTFGGRSGSICASVAFQRQT